MEETHIPRAGAPRKWRRIALAAVILLALAALIAWLARVPIASHFVDGTLAANDVPARYTIADLGFGRQRLENVVLGDPAYPDLVADWVETRTDIGVTGPTLVGVRAGRVRLRGRLVEGKLSLGAIDRLLPAPSGKHFALPAIDLDVADARMRLDTPYGAVGLKLSGTGHLRDGFRGALAAVGPRLRVGECSATQMTAALSIRIADQAPIIEGPVRADALVCGEVRATRPAARIAASLSPALDRWSGSARIAGGVLTHPSARVARFGGAIGFRGDSNGTAGTIAVEGTQFVTSGVGAASVAIDGQWRAGAQSAFEGALKARGAAIDPAIRRRIAAIGAAADGSPVAPLLRKLAVAAERGAGRFDVEASGIVAAAPISARADRLAMTAASGARVTLLDSAVVASSDGVTLNGRLGIAGGGLPDARIALAQRAVGEPIAGTVVMAPYQAKNARLALTPVRFAAASGGTTIMTVATVSGPLGDGRIEALTIPLDARWQGGRLTVNPRCAPISFDRLAISGLALRPARLTACPTGGALLRVANGAVSGGARIAADQFAGTLGSNPVTLAMSGANVSIGNRGFAIDGLSARLGQPDRATRLDVARLEGMLANGNVTGHFSGGAGQIGKVPLLLSDATGRWRLSRGILSVDGKLIVSDAAENPRFVPLAANNVALTLAGNAIQARGALVAAKTGTKVADVTIRHALSTGEGAADLTVAGIAFDDTLQPDDLTRLTYGVIADVKGKVSGDAHIAWSPQAVTSTGTFRTAGTDLAAAFGPVRGLSTEIRFTDLLDLESAPGQIATVAAINPGIPVEDGRIVYQTLPNNRVSVTGARWPFAGGTLSLDPTLLDFSAEQTRRLTFQVAGMDAGKFLQQFNFDNLTATGTFDGTLPMLFDASGGRIEDGTLVVRPGGGTIAYVGDLTQKDLGFWGNLAFQSLRSLKYQRLNVVMNGPLAGEMVTEVKFAGVSQGKGAKSNFLIRRLQKLPFVFNVRIKAPFRGLLDSVRSFYDPNRLIERNLPALIEEQNRAVQPPASATTPSQPKD